MDSTAENDYFELEPYDQYKPQDSKFSASLKWLLVKAYGNEIPSNLGEPFFEENELGKSLKNELMQELIGGKAYCLACRNIFNNTSKSKSSMIVDTYSNIADVFEQLAKNSIQVTDENDDPVTPQIIKQDSPFYVSAHLALIDSLMLAYSLKIMRLENVINSIKKFSKFSTSTEMPNNLESICALWLNKITRTTLNCVESECESYAKQASLVRCQPHLHLSEITNDISISLSNGTILAVLIVFYTCDSDIDLSDICLQENVGFEESVENLNLIKEFCDKYVETRPFCFNFEDFLYSPLTIKINKLAFIAELFYWFELNPIRDLISDNHFELFKDYIKKYTKRHFHVTTPFLSARIGDVTRNSFIKKAPYTPSMTTVSQVESNLTNNNFDSKLNTSVNNSYNSSLLDHVSLEASANLEETPTTTITNEQFNQPNHKELHLQQQLEQTSPSTSSSHSLFSSRTYVKSSNSNRMNLLSNENNKSSNNNNSNIINYSTVNVVAESSKFDSHKLNYQMTNNTTNSHSTTFNNNNNSNNSNNNVTNSIIANANNESTTSTDLKTYRVHNSSSNSSLPNVTNNNAATTGANSTSFYVSLNNENTSNESTTGNKQQQVLTSTSQASSQQQQQNTTGNSPPANQPGTGQTAGNGTGLVRRLSVTARPGDIFYKVKDVTESSSTTDGVSYENIEPTNETTSASVNSRLSPNAETNSSSPQLKPVESSVSPSSTQAVNTSTIRKTTTWNSKRNQTSSTSSTSALISHHQQSPSSAETSQTELVTNKQTPNSDANQNSSPSSSSIANNIEPGSPMFAKELLSIRMQLKEKKTSMERDKRKLESELEKQRQTIGKQVFLQVVQKKQQQQTNGNEQVQILQQQLSQLGSPLDGGSQSEKSVGGSNNSSNVRRQWDKTHKNIIDIENETGASVPVSQVEAAAAQPTNSTSSMSTPSSSASQSPPMGKLATGAASDPMAVDLSKAYYSRDEVMKAIESLKDKYTKESTTTTNTTPTSTLVQTTPSSSSTSATRIASSNIVKDIEVLNNKLAELQSEISRLTLLQQKQQTQQQLNHSLKQLNKSLNEHPPTVVDAEKRLLEQQSAKEAIDARMVKLENTPEANSDGLGTQGDGSFFISFGSGTAKREKPLALTPKKNLIFIKTNDEKTTNESKTNKPQNTNLLMTATKQLNTENGNAGGLTTTTTNGGLNLPDVGMDGDIDAGSSDGESSELKQRKREIILAKQLERRQQQELIRLKREEERARKAEELRLKEEEAANKKLLEKTRKETIFQAYIDKKKQLQDESGSGYFGHPNSLLSAKKFHSTNRLKSTTSRQQLHQQQQQQQQQQLLHIQQQQINATLDPFNFKQNLIDQFDQASIISDRSTFNPQTMIKTYSTNNLYHQTSNNHNIATSSNHNHNNNNNNNGSHTARKQSRVSRPPSCARPTISSLRKMNRTFSLNNVSEIGAQQQASQQQPAAAAAAAAVTATIQSQAISSGSSVSTPTQQQTSITHAMLIQQSLPMHDDSPVRTLSHKFGSKYASSNYLNDMMMVNNNRQTLSTVSQNSNGSVTQPASSQQQQLYPQQTRTTPRRRTPRNAEEFLIAAGIVDTDTFLSKGYYVGSMINLNEFTSSTNAAQCKSQTSTGQNDTSSNNVNNQSTSSSSSIKSNNTPAKVYPMLDADHHPITLQSPCEDHDQDDAQQLQQSSIKRRNSIHDTQSVSMANLNYISSNSNNEPAKLGQNGVNRTNSYYRNNPNYNKLRSMTTAIVPSSGGGGGGGGGGGNSTSNTSSAPVSDSSSSPTPSSLPNQQHKLNFMSQYNPLGPLMSAVSKMENTSSPKSSAPSGKLSNNLMFDDYDDYEYLERNLGLEPAKNGPTAAAINQNNSNTNATDYYTDESNSCHNEDFKSMNFHHHHHRFNGGIDYNQHPNTSSTPLNHVKHNNNNNNNNNTTLAQAFSTNANTTSNTTNTTTSTNNNNNNNIIINNSNYTNNQLQMNFNHANGMSLISNNNANWEHTTSTNSIFSGKPRSTSVPYRSPKLYKRLTSKTNKSTIINSLNQLVLAGTVNDKIRKQVVEEIEASDARHFVILFRDYHLQYRGVYSYTSETDYIEKLIGQGPQKISEDMIEKYYKYNSGGKQFSPVPTKHFSVQCDAVTIQSVYWQARKASNPTTNVNQLGIANANLNALGAISGASGGSLMQSPMSSNHNTLRR